MSQLRTRRAERRLSLRELAYFSECSHTTIARLERGDIDVSPSLKARIARALRVPVADLFAPDMREPGSGRAQGSRDNTVDAECSARIPRP